MTKENSHENRNKSQTRENGFGSNKGRNVSMAVIVGIGLALMLSAPSSMLIQEVFADEPPTVEEICAKNDELPTCKKLAKEAADKEVVANSGLVKAWDKMHTDTNIQSDEGIPCHYGQGDDCPGSLP